MVGLPRSGKSTISKNLGFPIVSPDAIRLALHGERYLEKAEPMVWTLSRLMVETLFLAGHTDVVLDSCSHTRRQRERWKGPWLRTYHCGRYGRYMLDPSVKPLHDFEGCMSVAETLNDEVIMPVIRRFYQEMEPVNINEFDKGGLVQ
jgi:hypothetical protein